MSTIGIADQPTSRLVTPAVERLILVLALLLFSGALHLAHAFYLQPSWEYLGMTYSQPGVARYCFGLALIVLAGVLVPTKFAAPSSVFIMALVFVVFVPTMVITLGLRQDAIERYGLQLLALATAFFACCLVCRSDSAASAPGPLPGPMFVRILLVAWATGSVVTLLVYGDRLRIVGFGDVYAQRGVGQTTSVAFAYLQTYYLNVICPAALAVGLLDRKRPWMILVALTGFGLSYSVAAQKVALFVPLVMLALYVSMTTVGRLMGLTASITISLAAAIGLGVWMYLEFGGNWFAALLVHRTLSIPGLTFSQYADFFGETGYTLWGHVRGFSAFMPVPHVLKQSPLWPNLGYLVGQHAYGDATHNLNANLFSSDGLAAAGPFGVLVIGAVFATWIKILDLAGRGWNRKFVALVLFPVAVSLTNGPLFTVLLSFGGIFWTVLFALYKPRSEPAPLSDEVPLMPQATTG